MANRTKMATLIMSAMIGEAVAAEFLRSLPAGERQATVDRITATVNVGIEAYANEKLASAEPKDIVGHQMMAEEMRRGVAPMMQELLGLAAKDE
jgi:hypothetical protein